MHTGGFGLVIVISLNLSLHTFLSSGQGSSDETVPGMTGIYNVKEYGATGAEIASSITGLPGHDVENITLSNIYIETLGGGTTEEAENDLPRHLRDRRALAVYPYFPLKISREPVPELEHYYPEAKMFGVLPAYSFFCRHVNGLSMHNVNVSWRNVDFRPMVMP